MGIREDNNLIEQIAHRAVKLYALHGRKIDPEFIISELKFVQFEVCELRLQDLLNANIGSFAHDITGIHNYLDMLDGSFREGFRPRFEKPR